MSTSRRMSHGEVARLHGALVQPAGAGRFGAGSSWGGAHLTASRLDPGWSDRGWAWLRGAGGIAVNPLQIMARSIARPLLRSAGPIQMEDWASMFTLGGLPGILNTSLKPTEEADVTNTFISLVNAAYRGNGVAFACMLARYSLFSEARFVWRQFRNSQPGPLFGTPELSILD